jgi:NDP-sugar pyrophosphorylase family protein
MSMLENPEAAGIYIFCTQVFEFLSSYTKNFNESFDLSKDILSNIENREGWKLFFYDIPDKNHSWVDVESPSYVERNKVMVDKVILLMESYLPKSE